MDSTNVAIIGAGPAGLTAGYLLAQRGVPVTVFESDPQHVGGISRTVSYRNYRFDIGGHRFFSKSPEVRALWQEILPDDLLTRPGSSRIYYRGKFFSYPLQPVEALRQLGPWESLRCVASYAAAQVRPARDPQNFADWVSNRFGPRLFSLFFKSYTEKVWGMDCREISADWAARRIQNLSLGRALRSAWRPRREGPGEGASLITSFEYPRHGPGMMWEACARKLQARGGRLELGTTVTGCAYDSSARQWTLQLRRASGEATQCHAQHVISSAPLRQLAHRLSPALPGGARAAAAKLRYRDFIMVALILPDRGTFPDNWIYLHDPRVKVCRIQNFRSWSPELVPEPGMCCYGLEYFCFEGDGLWNASDAELIDLATQELVQIGLARPREVTDGCVVRQPKASPVYDEDYARHVALVRQSLEAQFPTLHVVGRNGMHKYTNQDHAMMTAMLTVENILAGRRVYDVWQVNEDATYHEAGPAPVAPPPGSSSGLRQVPRRVAQPGRAS